MRKNILVTVCACLLALCAQAAETDIGAQLQKSFVWSTSAPEGKQAYVLFRKDFTLAAQPRGVVLNIFADSRFIAWINGEYVLRGPCRFDPKQPEYDSVDVSRFLRQGSNSIEVLVHHYAGGGNSKIMAHAPGLTAALNLPDRAIVTDSSWKCSRRTPYLSSPAAWGSIPDVMDGRIASGDSDWEEVIDVEGSKWGALRPRSIPLPRETELTGMKMLPSGAALSSSLPVELTAGKEILVDVGRMAIAWATVDLDADADSVLQLKYALRCVNGQPAETYGVGTTYTTRAGRQSFITGDEWGCHYVTVRCASGRIRLLGLKMTDRRYPFERVGKFSCNDEFLNRLWEMAVNTIEATSDDGYGADARERNEWLQDPAQPNFITTRVALAGPGSDGKPVYSDPRLLKNLMRHIATQQTSDGRLKAHALSDRWDCHGFIEDYACQWIESLRLYYDATGDKEFVREMWPALTKQMQWFLDHRSARGLVLARQYTSFDDPLAYVSCEGTALNAFVFQALKDSAYLSSVVGKKLFEHEATELADAINRQLWNAESGTYNSGFVKDKLLGPTAHAVLLALDRGVVPPDRVASVRTWFLANYKRPSGFHCCQNGDFEKMVADRAGIGMPVTYYWVFQELYRMDSPAMDEEAIQEMRRRWARMVNTSADTGTLWENFGSPESCHNYGSVPAFFLSSYVLGVRLAGPVWNKHLTIEPRLGDLTRAEGTVVTEFGPVPVSWKRQDNELNFHFEIPKGIQATLRLPDGDAKTLMLDGQKTRAEIQGRYIIVPAGAGVHEGRLQVKPPPLAANASVIEQQIATDSPSIEIIARTTDASPAGLETDIAKTGLARRIMTGTSCTVRVSFSRYSPSRPCGPVYGVNTSWHTHAKWFIRWVMNEMISQAGKQGCASLQCQTVPVHRILVVDDDQAILRLSARVLQRSGYEVDAAEDGSAAWDALHSKPYHLLITDNDMPKVSGLELLKKIHVARIEVPVIMATGKFPRAEFVRDPNLLPAATLLKPYTIGELVRTVKKVLLEAYDGIRPPRRHGGHRAVADASSRFIL